MENNKQLVFCRTSDGKKVEVACVVCPTCKNYFWVQYDQFSEPPKLCPYCGIGIGSLGNRA